MSVEARLKDFAVVAMGLSSASINTKYDNPSLILNNRIGLLVNACSLLLSQKLWLIRSFARQLFQGSIADVDLARHPIPYYRQREDQLHYELEETTIEHNLSKKARSDAELSRPFPLTARRRQLAMSSKLDVNVPHIFDRLEALIKSQSSEYPTVQEALVGLGAPIVSVGVLEAGKITAKIIGSPAPRKASATSEPVQQFDNETVFQACSISKPVTAFAVIKLCEEGVLDLDAPISRYLSAEQLSWISTPKTLPLVSQISLRLLISHTSGLSCHGFPGYPKSNVPTLQQTLQGEPPANHQPVRLEFLPGQKFSYSGGGFQVTQLIIETKLQRTFPEIIEELILKPLGMNQSTYRFLQAEEQNYAPAYLTGKQISDPDHHSMVESAAAGLWTTPSDLLKVIHVVQDTLESGDPLEQEWAKKMLTEVEDNGIALGWAVKTGKNYFGHGGDNFPGYACHFAGYRDIGEQKGKEGAKNNEAEVTSGRDEVILQRCGVSVMTSSALGHRVIGKIMAAIPYLNGWPSLYGENAVPFMDREKAVDERAKEWCGLWGSGKWSIVHEGEFSVQHGDLASVSLVSAAIPPHSYEQGDSIDLIADGLEMMLRLGWKDGLRIIEVWQDRQSTTLERNK